MARRGGTKNQQQHFATQGGKTFASVVVDMARWGLWIETGQSLMVCVLPKAGMDDLYKNGKNVQWTDRLPTTPDRKWNNDIPSQPFLEKKPRGHQWSPDFCCMLSPMWESEVSVAKESSVLESGYWSGTAMARRHFAFWKAPSAVSVHSYVLVPPFRRSVKGRKRAIKIHHA